MDAKFKWDEWDFDCDGGAYIIAKRECPEKENVADYIIKEDGLHIDCKDEMNIEEGWCKWQIRADWVDCEDTRTGGYYVETREPSTRNLLTGKRKPGWFPIWIIRKEEWY